MLISAANMNESEIEWRVVIWCDETDWVIPADEDDISRWADDGGS